MHCPRAWAAPSRALSRHIIATMADIEAIKRAARERATALKLPYAGALLPKEAHALMDAGAKLVDVRTKAELEWVGRVPDALSIEWNTWPGGKPNPDFVPQLE